VTDATAHRRDLARRLADGYLRETGARAVLLTGSAARGDADELSDLDLIAYYDSLPPEGLLRQVRSALGLPEPAVLSPRTEEGSGEELRLEGVGCQVGHATAARVERVLGRVLEECEPDAAAMKIAAGILEGLPLGDDGLVAGWQRRLASYPDGLARTLVERNLRFFPAWYVRDQLLRRDATLWISEICVESAYQVLAILAGLNRLYFSRFQFKRMRAFAAKMTVAPPGLAGRAERLFAGDPELALDELEALVRDTLALAAAHMPQVDTTMEHPPGTRHPGA
jgi:predicted nucleotidyltransferase